MGEALEIIELLNQLYLTSDLMNWADWMNDFCVFDSNGMGFGLISILVFIFGIYLHMTHNQAK